MKILYAVSLNFEYYKNGVIGPLPFLSNKKGPDPVWLLDKSPRSKKGEECEEAHSGLGTEWSPLVFILYSGEDQ